MNINLFHFDIFKIPSEIHAIACFLQGLPECPGPNNTGRVTPSHTATPSKYVTASLLPAVYHPGSANGSAAEISLANESEPDT